jgi:chromate transport protein ChrA
VRLDRYPAFRIALAVGTFVAAILVLASAWSLLKPYLKSGRWRFTLFIAVIAGGLSVVGWTPVRVLLVSAVAGALLPVQSAAPSAPSADRRRPEVTQA